MRFPFQLSLTIAWMIACPFDPDTLLRRSTGAETGTGAETAKALDFPVSQACCLNTSRCLNPQHQTDHTGDISRYKIEIIGNDLSMTMS